MKYLILFVVFVLTGCVEELGNIPINPPEPSIEPPPVEDKVNTLVGYTWEDSDAEEHLGQSYIGLPSGMLARSVIVEGTQFNYVSTWSNGSQLWYGPMVSTFKVPATILVVTTDGTKYKAEATVEQNPDPPKPDGKKIYAYDYSGLSNITRPTFRLRGKINNGDLLSGKCGPVTFSGTARPRKGGYGYERGRLVIKYPDNRHGIAILIDEKHNKMHFTAKDCYLTIN